LSYSFRERLKIAIAKDLKEKLRLSNKEVQHILENIMKICPISDEFAKALEKHDSRFKGKSLDQIIDMMNDQEFLEFVDEVLKEYRRRIALKKKKQKQSESESDSDSDGSQEQLEEEQVAQEATAESEKKHD